MNNPELYTSIENSFDKPDYVSTAFKTELQNIKATFCYCQQKPFERMLTGLIRKSCRDYRTCEMQFELQTVCNGALVWEDCVHLCEIHKMDVQDIKERLNSK